MNGPGLDISMEAGEVALARMDFGSANAIGTRLLKEFREALPGLRERAVRGLVITGIGRNFCSGLNLVEVLDMPRAEFTRFIRGFDELLMELLSFPAPVVAAINGNAVAGGCLLSIACDRRVMTNNDGFRIGFNEIVKGIPFPAGAMELVRRHLKPAAFARTVAAACVVRPSEAFAVGLVDRLELSANVVAAAVETCASLPAGSLEKFRGEKAARVAETLERVRERHASGAEPFVDAWFTDESQALLRGLRDKLTSKRS